ncbi:MAG: hypothetical protein AAF518_05665, partial [Spirochaetota bacterium]
EGIYVDNLHTTYALLPESYVLPACPKTGPDFATSLSYLQSIARYIPETIAKCHVLPEAKPKREEDKLFLLREFSLDGSKYLYIVKLFISHLGGASLEQTIQKESSSHNMSVRTDRIYYSIHIIPIRSVEKRNGNIVDFTSLNIPSIIETKISSKEPTEDTFAGVLPPTSIFDEVNYQTAIEPLKARLCVRRENWQPASIHEPIYIEYHTLSFRPLEVSFAKIKEEFAKFHRALQQTMQNVNDLETKALNAFITYLNRNTATRTVSPSGNICWKTFITN